MTTCCSRREFLRGGLATFTVGFLAPSLLTKMAAAQGASGSTLVVLYLAGGNDGLSSVVPYADPFYASRRPNISIPASQVLQIGTDAAGRPVGLHPRLTGLKTIFDEGHLAIVQRAGYGNSSRSHFVGTDIWSTGDPADKQPLGWIGRYFDSLRGPLDPLYGWNTTGQTPRSLVGSTFNVPAIPGIAQYNFLTTNSGSAGAAERAAAQRIASHLPVDRPHVAFVNAVATDAFRTVDRVQTVGAYTGTVAYPNTSLASALRTVAGAIVNSIGTRIFWVVTGGFDTHANQQTRQGGFYFNLLATLNDAVAAFYADLRNQGASRDVVLMQFSEFGRRITENGSQGTDHGAASVMFILGGSVRGGLYGTAPDLNPAPDNPTLESNGGDVRYETDFRSVYARVVDNWLGGNSVTVLGADYRDPRVNFL